MFAPISFRLLITAANHATVRRNTDPTPTVFFFLFLLLRFVEITAAEISRCSTDSLLIPISTGRVRSVHKNNGRTLPQTLDFDFSGVSSSSSLIFSKKKRTEMVSMGGRAAGRCRNTSVDGLRTQVTELWPWHFEIFVVGISPPHSLALPVACVYLLYICREVGSRRSRARRRGVGWVGSVGRKERKHVSL